MSLKALFGDNRIRVAFTLSLVWLLVVWQFRTVNSFLYPLLAVALVAFFDLAITWLRDHKLYFPSSSLVTGFLIGLIIAPTEPLWIIAVAAFGAVLSKQFIGRGVRQHIFNPAAFGIMATSLVFGTAVSWWGFSWGILPLIVLVPLMVRVLARIKRLMLPVTFLATYFVYLLFQFAPKYAFTTLMDGTFLLFALVMLPEPITSKAQGSFKYLFGVMVAVLSIILSGAKFLPDAFLPALLASNLIGFLILRFGKTSGQAKSPNQD